MADFDWEKDSAPAPRSGFDWEQESAPAGSGTSPTSSVAGAALRGFGQGLTADFGDELGGAIQAGLQSAANALPAGALDWAGIDNRYQQDPLATYRKARDANRAELARDMEEHPVASTAGNLAGSVVQDALLPGSAATGYAAAARAGAMGAAAGLGASESDLTRGKVGGAIADTLQGAALGLAGQEVGEQLGRVSPEVAQWVQRKSNDFAAMRALNAAGYGYNELKPIIRDFGKDKAVQMGQHLLDEPGVIRAGRGVEDVLEGVQGARSAWGEEMGRILKDADGTGARFDMSRVAQRAMDEIIKPNIDNPAISDEVRAVAERLRQYLANSQDGISFSKANQWKSTLDGTLNWGNRWNNFGPSETLEKYQKQLAGIFRDEIDNQLGGALGEDAFSAFRNAKAHVGTFKDAEGKARLLNAAVEGKNAVSLKDLGVGTLAGGGIPGLAATLASKLGRERGAAVLARGADAFANSATLESIARANPEAFGKYASIVTSALARGPGALAAMDKVLRDTDPEWRQLREEQGKSAR